MVEVVGMWRSVFISIVFPVIALSPPNVSAEISFDELYRLLLIGQWEQVSDVYAVSSFSASMKYEASIYRSEEKHDRLAQLEGVWGVENGLLIIRLSNTYPAELPAGTVVSEKIHSINGGKLVLIDKNGKRYSKKRLRGIIGPENKISR